MKTKNYKPTDFERVYALALADVQVLKEKGASYGDSWRSRGGVGAFMMMARKWDRIENQCKSHKFDVFTAAEVYTGADGILDDIADLRRYLLLVEEHILSNGLEEATGAYVNQ